MWTGCGWLHDPKPIGPAGLHLQYYGLSPPPHDGAVRSATTASQLFPLTIMEIEEKPRVHRSLLPWPWRAGPRAPSFAFCYNKKEQQYKYMKHLRVLRVGLQVRVLVLSLGPTQPGNLSWQTY